MYCVGCGKEIGRGANFCSGCGKAPLAPAQPDGVDATGVGTVRTSGPTWLFCVIGGLLGCIIGYLTRPSAMLVGQLPFQMVITGGATLQGLDQLLAPIAQQSFNQLLTGTIIGAVLGGVGGAIISRIKSGSQQGSVGL